MNDNTKKIIKTIGLLAKILQNKKNLQENSPHSSGGNFPAKTETSPFIQPEELELEKSLVQEEIETPVFNPVKIFTGEEKCQENEDEEVFTQKSTKILDIGEESGYTSKKHCSKFPVTTTARKNRFRDNGIFSEDTNSFDKVVRTDKSIQYRQSITKRPAPNKIIACCRDCKNKFKIDPFLAPQNLGNLEDSEYSSYVCQRCLNNKPRTR